MAFLAAAASGFTLPQAAPAVVMARPQFSSVAPVMMAKKGEDVPWSIDTLLAGPKAKFVASGVELLSGVGRPINGKTVKVDATAYACRFVEAGTHLARRHAVSMPSYPDAPEAIRGARTDSCSVPTPEWLPPMAWQASTPGTTPLADCSPHFCPHRTRAASRRRRRRRRRARSRRACGRRAASRSERRSQTLQRKIRQQRPQRRVCVGNRAARIASTYA